MYNRLGEVQLVLIDPKGRGFATFADLPHLLYPLVDDVEGASEVLERLVVEMERRDREKATQPQVVVFIDELADLMMVGGKGMEFLLTRLLQRGRGAGIHLVASRGCQGGLWTGWDGGGEAAGAGRLPGDSPGAGDALAGRLRIQSGDPRADGPSQGGRTPEPAVAGGGHWDGWAGDAFEAPGRQAETGEVKKKGFR
jgi:hypothetical protein